MSARQSKSLSLKRFDDKLRFRQRLRNLANENPFLSDFRLNWL
jgi:hypothetical protein